MKIHHKDTKKTFLLLAFLCVLCDFVVSPTSGQEKKASAQDKRAEEMSRDLSRAMSKAEGPLETIQALEGHLKRYPDNLRRLELYRTIINASNEINDEARVVEYGEKVLAEDSEDVPLLELVARLLLGRGDAASAARAVRYGDLLVSAVPKLVERRAPRQMSGPRWQYEKDRNLARAHLVRGTALLRSGRPEKAREDLEQCWSLARTGEAAERLGEMEEKLGRTDAAIEHYVEAFAVPDPRHTADDKQRIRRKLAELYRAAERPETDLGTRILAAYDRLAAEQAERMAWRRASANAGRSNPFEFQLKRPDGATARLADFLGKVIVVDFWATWCAPCLEQHPLLEKVEAQFRAGRQVVFLSVNTDEDVSLVKPFLEREKWKADVVLDDGLARYYEVDSIPTLLVFNRKGQIAHREPGFQPYRFVENLTARIEEALR